MSFSPLRSDARVLRQVNLFAQRYAVTTLGYGEAPDGVVEHLRLPDDVVSWHKDRRLLMSRRFETAYRTSPVVQAAARLLEGRRARFDVGLADDVDTVPLALDLAYLRFAIFPFMFTERLFACTSHRTPVFQKFDKHAVRLFLVWMEILICHFHIPFLVFLLLVFGFVFFFLSLVFSYVFILRLSVRLNIKASSIRPLAV